jgi:osmotically inducible protein OsmC
MQLAHGLVGAGWEPEEIYVSANVSFEQGIGITGIELTARVVSEGIPDELLRQTAERAKATCPVSKALAGVEITLTLPDLPPPEDEDEPADEQLAPVGDADDEQ